MDKEVRKLVAALERIEGVEVERGGSHLKVRRRGVFVTTIPVTPSDNRWKNNTLADLKRVGITPAVRPEKLSRQPRTIPPRELASQLRGLQERRQVTEFARFTQQLGEVRGLRIYKSLSSAANSIAAIASGKTTRPADWSSVLLSESLIAWQQSTPQPGDAPLKAEAMAEVAATPDNAPVLTLVVNLDELAVRLAEFGIEIRLEGGASS